MMKIFKHIMYSFIFDELFLHIDSDYYVVLLFIQVLMLEFHFLFGYSTFRFRLFSSVNSARKISLMDYNYSVETTIKNENEQEL